MSLGTVKGKLRIAGLLTVKKDRELAVEGLGEEGNVTLECLWLTEED